MDDVESQYGVCPMGTFFFCREKGQKNRPGILQVCFFLLNFGEDHALAQLWGVLLKLKLFRSIPLVLGSQVDTFAGFGATKDNVVTHLIHPLSI